MQAKLVMASLKGEQLRTTLELLMPTLGMGAFFYCYKAIPLEGPLYLVAGLGGERNTCCQVWLCGAGEAGGQGCLSIMQMGMASGLSSSLTSLPTWHFQAISPRFFKAYSAFSRAVSHLPIFHAVTLSVLHLASLHPFAVLHRPGASLVAQW